MKTEKCTERLLIFFTVVLALVALAACSSQEQKLSKDEMKEYEAFYLHNRDSMSLVPRNTRTKVFQKMETLKDSLVRNRYLILASTTYLRTSEFDSVQLLVKQIEDFAARQKKSTQLSELISECYNMKGNVFARTRQMDSAEVYFRKAYEELMNSSNLKGAPDILTNLADVSNAMGKFDVGASCYRRALLLCDSLQLVSSKKVPIYYGLAQTYMELRDFDQCDHYYNLASRSFENMLPFEKHYYLNNRGNSYYFRGDYETAISYFKQSIDLVKDSPDMPYELNLGWLNLGDCYLQINEADSAEKYINKCYPFFYKYDITPALYYIDTQNIILSLQRKDLSKAKRIQTEGISSVGIDQTMLHIRNKYLQQYYEKKEDYKNAYSYLKNNTQMDDSIRNERVTMRTVDLALRYQQDSTMMAQKVFIREKENEVLELRQTIIFWIAISCMILLVVIFVHMYNNKKNSLLQEQNRRTVSTLRMENIRNRLSPHFIFNVLNREIVGRKKEEQDELSSLVKLMRRNLELAEKLCITLGEELDFVKTYIALERRSLGSEFKLMIEIDKDINIDEVCIPSMFIQIPVENVVKHALREKEGERNLWIIIDKKENGTSIKIRDNGGGFRLNSNNKGTGTGMKVVMQTIHIMNMRNREAIDIDVHNVTLLNGEIGCEVTFWLPTDYRYEI